VPGTERDPRPVPRSAPVSTVAALGSHRAAWDALVGSQPVASPFQRSWWLEGVAPEGTTYLLVLDGGRLVGGVALRERRTCGVPTYVAPGPAVLCPDHLDLMAEPGAEDAVVGAVGAWFSRPGQRILDLRGVVEDALLARAVDAEAEPSDVAPFQRLPDRAEDYLAGRSSNFRRSVRRSARSLAAAGIDHRRLTAEDLPGGFAAFRSLHDGRDGRAPLLAEMAALERAVTDGVARGEARVDVLASDDEVAAVSIAFVTDGRLSLYQVARSLDSRHDGAGTVLIVRVIEDAVAAGCHEADLLRGGEGYKSSFTDETRPVGRLRAAHGAVARGVLAAEDAARRVSARLRSPAP
jgi:CelD/BcsL family acetyltransferase involved in cellulose biosynthesis